MTDDLRSNDEQSLNSNKFVPLLEELYQQYLDDEDSAAFIKAVSLRYTIGTLVRLAEYGSYVRRRAAILALGFLANYDSNAVLGRAMHDKDRGVRLLAENGIRELWNRGCSDSQRQQLSSVYRLNTSRQFEHAIDQATKLIEEVPWLAEAWNQRAIAYYHLERYNDSANDCHQSLELNPYHFAAAVGMGHCYLELEDAFAALKSFRRALRLNPNLESVRAQVDFLQRTLEEK